MWVSKNAEEEVIWQREWGLSRGRGRGCGAQRDNHPLGLAKCQFFGVLVSYVWGALAASCKNPFMSMCGRVAFVAVFKLAK